MGETGVVHAFKWRAHYKDGSFLDETANDISVNDPSKSSFADVKHADVVAFELLEVNGSRSIGVNLLEGRFEVNGLPIWVGGILPPPPEVAKLSLVFYRQHQKHYHVGASDPHGHTIRYCLGWQAMVDGKNMQEVIGVF